MLFNKGKELDISIRYEIFQLFVMLFKRGANSTRMIEQPLEAGDLVDHAKLQKRLKTRICLDESITSLRDTRHALELDACRIINIKIGRVGGHCEAKAIQAFTEKKTFPSGAAECSKQESVALIILRCLRFRASFCPAIFPPPPDIGRKISSSRLSLSARKGKSKHRQLRELATKLKKL